MKIKSNYANGKYYLLLLIAASFVLQPLNIRIGNDLPLSASLMGIFILLGFISIPFSKINKRDYLAAAIVALCSLILLSHILLSGQTSRGFIVLSYFVFIITIFFTDVDLEHLNRVWFAVGITCFVLILIGMWRFTHGLDAPFSENESGVSLQIPKYYYLGLSYLPSTRNSDVFYFCMGMVANLYFIDLYRGRNKVFYFSLVLFVAAVVLSLSRSAWVAFLVSFFLVYSTPKRLLVFLICAAVLIAFMLFYWGVDNVIVNLVLGGLLSVFSPDAAHKYLAIAYTYSNVDRGDIYLSALGDIVRMPFGCGVDYSPSYRFINEVATVHSENTFLDLLMIIGYPAIFFIYYVILRPVVDLWQRRHRGSPPVKLVLSAGIFIIVFHLFNSAVDFAFLWFILGLIMLTSKAILRNG
ncbi:MAG TPA: O-antigen ligase family protein [Candidatus Omnitrophota bacterium]|nr:O-antigen ligase family protein [Candidatus Omnitrophota bacterium]HPS36513.1 O-antigen ligase family protein [Candidatus Omnitrophota bacterium]